MGFRFGMGPSARMGVTGRRGWRAVRAGGGLSALRSRDLPPRMQCGSSWKRLLCRLAHGKGDVLQTLLVGCGHYEVDV